MLNLQKSTRRGMFLQFKNNFYLLKKSINYQSDDRRHVRDCVQQVQQQSSDHVDNLENLEIGISNMTKLALKG